MTVLTFQGDTFVAAHIAAITRDKKRVTIQLAHIEQAYDYDFESEMGADIALSQVTATLIRSTL